MTISKFSAYAGQSTFQRSINLQAKVARVHTLVESAYSKLFF